jgi:hypothetical protein
MDMREGGMPATAGDHEAIQDNEMRDKSRTKIR